MIGAGEIEYWVEPRVPSLASHIPPIPIARMVPKLRDSNLDTILPQTN